ncbi:MAG: hypothetical protein ACOYN0_17065, partial [Phycisphaerales bacterium]
ALLLTLLLALLLAGLLTLTLAATTAPSAPSAFAAGFHEITSFGPFGGPVRQTPPRNLAAIAPHGRQGNSAAFGLGAVGARVHALR